MPPEDNPADDVEITKEEWLEGRIRSLEAERDYWERQQTEAAQERDAAIKRAEAEKEFRDVVLGYLQSFQQFRDGDGDPIRFIKSLHERAEALEKLTGQMTTEEAQAAYDAAEPIPISEERIKKIVDYATRDTRRIKELESALRDRDAAIAALTLEMQEMAEERHLLHGKNEDAFWGCSQRACQRAASFIRRHDAGKPLLARLEGAELVCKAVKEFGGVADDETAAWDALRSKP